MTRLPPEAAEALKDIFRRMPPGTEDAPSGDRAIWDREIGEWRNRGLQARRDRRERHIWVEFYGQLVPGSLIHIRSNGVVDCQHWGLDPFDPPPRGWTPPLELPGPGQDLNVFLEKNRLRRLPDARWPLNILIGRMIRRGLKPGTDLHRRFTGMSPYCTYSGAMPDHTAQAEWIRLTMDMMDPKALPRLKQWTGQTVKRNLPNYNLAMQCGDFLEQLATSDPGALAWWFAQRQQQQEKETPEPRWLLPPDYDGEIIRQVKQEFEAAGGANWRDLAGQPANHIAELLKREGRQAAAWVAEALAQARPPEGEPPLEIKLLLARLAVTTMAPDGESRRRNHGRTPQPRPRWPHRTADDIRKGVKVMGVLACRHFAGRQPSPDPETAQELNRRFNQVAEYVFDHPKAAAQAVCWRQLEQAADRWHHHGG